MSARTKARKRALDILFQADVRGEDVAMTLAAESNATQVRITVSDNGTGMTRQESEKMFDPFFTTRKTGTGLGLAVSHQIIEQLGGTFEVVTAPGAGTGHDIRAPRLVPDPAQCETSSGSMGLHSVRGRS